VRIEYAVSRCRTCDYLLNLDHPIGGAKAAWFNSVGYSVDNWEMLAYDLRQMAVKSDDFVAKASPWGVKYELEGLLGCPGYRPGKVVAVWIVEENLAPRLITAYPA
jgi:hypothetical protein